MINWNRYLVPVLTAFIIYPIQISAYESVPVAHVSEVLSPNLAQSLYHRVEEVRLQDRFYHFQIESDFGTYDVLSLAMLKKRVFEIKTLGNAINEFSRLDDNFSDELKGELRVSADYALDIITRPISTATNIAGQMANNLNDTLSGIPVEAEKSFSYNGGESSDPTIAMHKRNIASQWGLDVYSSNPKVQEFLNAVAGKRSAGNISAGTPSLGGRPGNFMKIANRDLEIEFFLLLKNKSVDELNLINDQILSGLRIEPEQKESFLQSHVFSPTHKTRIAHYLASLQGVRNMAAFFQVALEAQDESMALAAEHCAIILAYYHQAVEKLAKLHASDDMLQAVTINDRILYISPNDVIYWSEQMEMLFNKLLAHAARSGFTYKELIVSGSLTDEAREELTKKGINIREGMGL